MLKLNRIFAAMLCLVTLLTAVSCAAERDGEDTAEQGGEWQYTFTDSSGASVTLTEKPDTIAVLFTSLADIWQLSGGDIAVTVGESVERGFAANGVTLVDEGSGHSVIDLETLAAAEPDLVIGTADYACQVEAAEFCRDAGIPAAVFKVESVDDYLGVLRIFCDINDSGEAYETYGTAVKARIEAIFADAEQKRSDADYCAPEILFVRAGSSERSTKAKTTADMFACAMQSELGAVNIADDIPELADSLSLEAIIEADPDYLFVSTMGDEQVAVDYFNSLLESDGWRDLTCVKNGCVYYLPKELFHYKPNSRWAEAYEYLVDILFPQDGD